MIGDRQVIQEALFYEFSLEGHVPADHLLRSIDRSIDLSGLRAQIAPYYSPTGRPSIDPGLLMRMLNIGYLMWIATGLAVHRINAVIADMIAVIYARAMAAYVWEIMLTTTSPVLTLRPQSELDYYDSRSITLPTAITPLEAWNLMTAEPGLLMRLAFRTRDAISSLFGVKRIGGFSGARRETVKVGDRLDFFLVEHSAPDMLVLTERDRHLDVMICLSIADRLLTITSSVVTHNTFGRIYMVPVGPAHKLIIGSDLRRSKRKLEEMASLNTKQVQPPS